MIEPHHRVVEPPAADRPPFPPTLLAGEVALVTGGGSGMGLAAAEALARGGAGIAIVGRSIERAEAGAARMRAIGVAATAIACDVRDAGQVAAAFDAAERALGPVTLLANNAGANFPVLAEDISPNAWNAVTRIAIDGSFHCAAEFARRRIATGGGGAIVNNSAQYIRTGFPADVHSAAAKTAQAGMTPAMARDWDPHGIRVNAIAAGFFPHARSTSGDSTAAEARLAGMIPAGRTGRMHEYGWLSALLCSPLLAGVTGQIVTIDGGESLRRSLFAPDFVPPRERANPWGWQ